MLLLKTVLQSTQHVSIPAGAEFADLTSSKGPPLLLLPEDLSLDLADQLRLLTLQAHQLTGNVCTAKARLSMQQSDGLCRG